MDVTLGLSTSTDGSPECGRLRRMEDAREGHGVGVQSHVGKKGKDFYVQTTLHIRETRKTPGTKFRKRD